MAATSALLTDHYELTMLRAALASGTAQRRCVFEVFARRLPEGRRYGVVAGTARIVEAVQAFRFGEAELEHLTGAGVVDPDTAQLLAAWRFTGDIDGFAEGECFFPGSPLLVVEAPFAEAVLLETLVLSILNHDCAIAAAASRMVTAAGDRPCLDMGSRRTHEQAAVAAARASYLAGFSATSNLEAGRTYGVPTMGTSAHAFTLLHTSEREAFAAQLAALGTGTTLLVDTYDVETAVRTAVELAGPQLGAVRLDSGDLAAQAHHVRALLDSLGATGTRIVASGDLDEYRLAELREAPFDSYGIGTSLVTGSGAPTAGLVYKLVARAADDSPQAPLLPVAKRSPGKATVAGRKYAARRYDAEGVATADAVGSDPRELPGERPLLVPLVRSGVPTGTPGSALREAREHHRRSRAELPASARQITPGTPALPTVAAAGTGGNTS